MTRGMTPCLLAWLLFPCLALSKEDPTSLPKPDVDGAMPLEQALAKRRSVRGFSSKELSPAQVSQLLWACQGVTSLLRRRTAPSAFERISAVSSTSTSTCTSCPRNASM